MLSLFCGILSIYQIKMTRDIFEWKIFALKDFGIIIIFGHHMSIKVASTCVCVVRGMEKKLNWLVEKWMFSQMTSNMSDQFNTNVPIHMKQVLFFRIRLEIYSSKTSPSEHFMCRGKTTDGPRFPTTLAIYTKRCARNSDSLLRTTQRPQKTTYTHRAFTCDFNIFFKSLSSYIVLYT